MSRIDQREGRFVDTPSSKVAITIVSLTLLVDMVAYGMIVPLLPVLPALVQRGNSVTGVLFASYAAAMIIITPVAGRIVDKYGPKFPMLVGTVVLLVSTVLFGYGEELAVIAVARVMQGFAAGLTWVAGLALIAQTTPLYRRGRAMATVMSVVAVGTLAGPPVGGVIAGRWGIHAPFLLVGLCVLGIFVLQIAFLQRSSVSPDDLATAYDVFRIRGTVPISLLIVLVSSILASAEALLPRYLIGQFNLSLTHIGIVFSMAILVSAIVNPLSGRLMEKISLKLLVGSGVTCGVAGLVIIALAPNLLTIIVGLVFLGISAGLMSPPLTTLIGFQGEKTTPPTLGGAYALYNLTYACGMMVGPLASGLLVESLGWKFGVLTTAALVCVLILAVPRLPVSNRRSAAI